MGKGDQRTRRGKIFRGTFGKRRRPRKTKVIKSAPAEPEVSEPKKATSKKKKPEKASA